jgi:enamine deaminase RidA (YjgF/YER057c/UK114 family)
MSVYERLKQLSLKLPSPPSPGGAYAPIVEFGEGYLYTSGTGCSADGRPIYTGRLGAGVPLEQGRLAARQCILNTLANLDAFMGDLNRIERVIKATVFVASDDDFYSQSAVADGASELLFELFGEKGRGARSAIGVNVLPKNQPVEIEIIFQVRPAAANQKSG